LKLTDELRSDYARLFRSAAFFSRISEDAAIAAVKAITARAPRDQYEIVSKLTSVPWWVVGVIHHMESSGDFRAHLHNGDPLTGRTVHFPPGRPKLGGPPFTWTDSAADALKFEGLDRWTEWTIAGSLYVFERYNGFGYRGLKPPIPSPYLWSGLNHYRQGKFVEEKVEGKWKSVFKPELVSQQIGAAAITKVLVDRKIVVINSQQQP
jgi:lysozyme family protein